MPVPHILIFWMAIVTLFACLAGIQLLNLPRFAEVRAGRLTSIDGLRGLLAIVVFFHHFYENYFYRVTGVWGSDSSIVYNLFGTVGVTLFFMITGFLFFGKIRAVRGHIDFNRFYLGRIFRIVPVYAVSVLFVYLMTFIETGFRIDRTLQPGLDQWVFFHNAIINDYPASPMINAAVTWTLVTEWIFYLSIPVIAYLWSRLDLQSWAVALATVLALYLQRNDVSIPGIDLNCGQFAPFLLGGLAGEIGRMAVLRRAAKGHWSAALSVAALSILFGTFSTAYSVSGCLLLFVFFVPVALGNSIFGVLRLRAVVFLGEISYDVYMLHGIVLFALFTVMLPNAMQSVQSRWQMLPLMLIAAAVVIALSFAVHLAVEKPMLRLGRRLTSIDETQNLAAP